jgi:ferrous iron transport protein B
MPPVPDRLTIAIAGNPNAGKTCIFNALTGSLREVANYPGVTVEFYEGTGVFGTEKARVVDLPGTYSLTAYSQEELVARDFLLDRHPDVVINVVDAGNLERNLYFTIQLIELGVPMVLALNMMDVAESKGIRIDAARLSALLGVKVVPTMGSRGRGVDALKAACLETAAQGLRPHTLVLTHELSFAVEPLLAAVRADAAFRAHGPAPWLALKLLEDDPRILALLDRATDPEPIRRATAESRRRLHEHSHEDAAMAIGEFRYGFVAGLLREVVRMPAQTRRLVSDAIDAVVCHRLLGPAILGLIVYLTFFIVFKVSDEWAWLPYPDGEWVSPTGFLGRTFELASGLVERLVPSPAVQSLVCDGIIGGVGGVMEFVPLIFFMFLFIAFLEDSGYVARVAFILDRILRTFGLQGKSALALLVSGGLGAGGCAVPGILATRTMREEKDRLVTMLVAPMMNCGAKLPVYAMLIAAFFAGSRGLVMFSLWLISWVMAVAAAWMLRRWVIRGEQTPFVMELPVYHWPTPRGMLIHTWSRTWMFIRKAGTIILAVNVALWMLMYYPRLSEARMAELTAEAVAAAGDEAPETEALIAREQLRNSFAGRFGRLLEPVGSLAGFDWRDNIALLGGLAAKEVVVGTLGTAYAMTDVDPEASSSLSARLAADPDWGPLRAFALMLFVMIYAPCLPTVAVIRREAGGWRWAFFAMAYQTAFGFIVAVAVYRLGLLFAG